MIFAVRDYYVSLINICAFIWAWINYNNSSVIAFDTTDTLKLTDNYSVAELLLKDEINRFRDFASFGF